MKHKQPLCPRSSFSSRNDGPVPLHGPAQRSMVQAELIYPSAVQSNLNKQISPYQHLEPLMYRDQGNHRSSISLTVSVCVRARFLFITMSQYDSILQRSFEGHNTATVSQVPSVQLDGVTPEAK